MLLKKITSWKKCWLRTVWSTVASAYEMKCPCWEWTKDMPTPKSNFVLTWRYTECRYVVWYYSCSSICIRCRLCTRHYEQVPLLNQKSTDSFFVRYWKNRFSWSTASTTTRTHPRTSRANPALFTAEPDVTIQKENCLLSFYRIIRREKQLEW